MNNLPYEKLPYEKIGRVIRASADMEAQLWSILSALLGTDQFRSRVVASAMPNLTQKISLIKRLSDTYLPEEEAEKLRKMLERSKRLAAKRNMLAHETMHINLAEDKNLVFRDSFDDKGLGFTMVEFPAKELDDLAQAIGKLTHELQLFVFDISGKVFKKSRTHREDNASSGK